MRMGQFVLRADSVRGLQPRTPGRAAGSDGSTSPSGRQPLSTARLRETVSRRGASTSRHPPAAGPMLGCSARAKTVGMRACRRTLLAKAGLHTGNRQPIRRAETFHPGPGEVIMKRRSDAAFVRRPFRPAQRPCAAGVSAAWLRDSGNGGLRFAMSRDDLMEYDLLMFERAVDGTLHVRRTDPRADGAGDRGGRLARASGTDGFALGAAAVVGYAHALRSALTPLLRPPSGHAAACLATPSFFMRERSVLGCRPSHAAAFPRR